MLWVYGHLKDINSGPRAERVIVKEQFSIALSQIDSHTQDRQELVLMRMIC